MKKEKKMIFTLNSGKSIVQTVPISEIEKIYDSYIKGKNDASSEYVIDLKKPSKIEGEPWSERVTIVVSQIAAIQVEDKDKKFLD